MIKLIRESIDRSTFGRGIYKAFLGLIFYSGFVLIPLNLFLGFELSYLGFFIGCAFAFVSSLFLRLEIVLADKGIFASVHDRLGNINFAVVFYFFLSFLFFKYFFLYCLNVAVSDKGYEYRYIAPSTSSVRYGCNFKINIKSDPAAYSNIISLCVSEKKFKKYFRNGKIHLLTNKVPLEVWASPFGKDYKL